MRSITYSQALREAIHEEMLKDKSVFVIGEDIGVHGGIFKVTDGFLKEFGKKRVRTAPISEAAIAGAAIGASLLGMRPVAEIMYVDFMTIAMDQIVNQAAKIRYMFGGKVTVPVVIRTQGGAGSGEAAQHCQSLEAWFTHVPGLKVVMPSNPYDAKGLLKSAIRDNNPVIFIEHKLLYSTKGFVPEEEYVIPLGKAEVKKSGVDVTVVATSRMVNLSMKASEKLEKEGIRVEVIDPRTLIPLDKNVIVGSIKKTGHLVIVQEAVKTSGFGAEIAAFVAEEAIEFLKAPIIRIAGFDAPIPYSQVLEEQVIPNEDRIINGIKKVLSNKS
jgi:pyruvate/2-oxoglutarate/acetoin dehydrogenase E1 component